MAKHRRMMYHHAGAKTLTVEIVSIGDFEGERIERTANREIDEPLILAKLADLEAAVDALLDLTDEPKPAPVPEPGVEP